MVYLSVFLDYSFIHPIFSFHALSVKLGSPQQKYFIGDQPTELDALAFGHIYTILVCHLLINKNTK
jgi:hypothetical protein